MVVWKLLCLFMYCKFLVIWVGLFGIVRERKILIFKIVLRFLKRIFFVVFGFVIFNLFGNGIKLWWRIVYLVEMVYGNWLEIKFGFSISGSRVVNWFFCVNCKYWDKIRLIKIEFLFDCIKKIFFVYNFNIKKK